MAATQEISKSILSEVAQHERELLSQVEAAQESARQTVDSARGEARNHLQQSAAELLEQVAGLRREGESARQSQFEATVNVAEERLSGQRGSASDKVPQMTKDVLSLFLPKGTGA